MKSILCFFLLSLSAAAQISPFNQNPIISLPIYYYPFYDSVQIIEVDYYTKSLDEGALQDAMYPRGGSSYHDAMLFNRPNGYLVRHLNGKIIANYGVPNLEQFQLTSPDSCQKITHKERLNTIRNHGYQADEKVLKDINGYGYRIMRFFVPKPRTEMPEMAVQLFGILDTLGKIAIPMNHLGIDYANGEYLVSRHKRLFETATFPSIQLAENPKTTHPEYKAFAIYDSTFQLTLPGSDLPLRRIAPNRFATVAPGCISFMDRNGTGLHQNNYQALQDASYGELMIYAAYHNDSLRCGLLSRQLEEVTPAIYYAIVPQEHGFLLGNPPRKNGYLNLQGKTLVPFELQAEHIEYRRDHFIVFTRYVDMPNGKMLCSGLIDTTGKILLPAEYWEIGHFQNELALVKKDNKWGFINRSGEVLCPTIYNIIGQMHRNFIEVTMGNKQGLVDRLGKSILEPNYTDLAWYDSLIHYANDQNSHFIYDLRTGKKHEHTFGKLIPQVNGLSFFLKDNKYGLVNAQGKLILPAQYDKIRAYRNNRAVVEINGKYGLIDEHGTIIQAIKYSGYGNDADGNYMLK
jgi:multimeric flavodoxin WrbA